ncbi:MAG: hypothetical protein JWL82_218 [Parcubacteria group bacterium]|nr:hypothetical protein [Parcubacteria group bacterium]
MKIVTNGVGVSTTHRTGICVIFGLFLFALPLAPAHATVVFLTSGTSWAMPVDAPSTFQVEVIGAGGNGYDDGSPGSGGGGGGGYAIRTQDWSPLLSGGNFSYSIGGAGSVVWFGANGAGGVVANSGANGGATGTGGAGGSTTGEVGDVVRSGGAGGLGNGNGNGNGGGGGAAGPASNGGAGGYGGCGQGGGGGGAGGTGTATNGTNNNCGNTPGGSVGGGQGQNGATLATAGTQDTVWTQTSNSATAGPGGGGGSGQQGTTSGGNSAGGSYGGGGGGTRFTNTGVGGPGLIVITYSPIIIPSRTMRLFEGFRIKFVSGRILLRQK